MATSFLPFSLSCYSIQNVSRLEPSCFQLGNFCEGERWAHTQMSVVLQNFLTVDCYGIDKKKTRQMPFFFVCLYLHNVRSYMAKIFRDEIKSPFAFSHIFLRATRWCWWRQYKNIQSLLGDVVARENIYQSASTWSCWPIINSQCWNVHFFSFKLRCAKTLPKNGFWFNLSFYIKSQRDEDKSTGKTRRSFSRQKLKFQWNFNISRGPIFLCIRSKTFHGSVRYANDRFLESCQLTDSWPKTNPKEFS